MVWTTVQQVNNSSVDKVVEKEGKRWQKAEDVLGLEFRDPRKCMLFEAETLYPGDYIHREEPNGYI